MLLGFNSLQDGTFAAQDDAKRVLGLGFFCIDNDC